jgi:hypothetical protein
VGWSPAHAFDLEVDLVDGALAVAAGIHGIES